jgi:hypothetical protein
MYSVMGDLISADAAGTVPELGDFQHDAAIEVTLGSLQRPERSECFCTGWRKTN